MFNILVVEDDRNAARLMQITLGEAGYKVKLAGNGLVALKKLESEYVDLIIVDLMMPEMNGHEFITAIRNNGINTPVIVVTAKLLAEDKYKAFVEGADDYITKPVDTQELLLRIKALLRRANIISEQKLTVGNVELDYQALSVTKNGVTYTMPKKEFYLLFKLLSYPNQIFTRIQLMDEIWGMETNSVETTVNVHINRLRKKFSEWPEFDIVSIKGVGYKAVINSEE